MQDPGGGGGDLKQGEGVSPLPPCPAPRPDRPSSSHQYLQVSELQINQIFIFFSFTLMMSIVHEIKPQAYSLYRTDANVARV